jgi:hypothetical protein
MTSTSEPIAMSTPSPLTPEDQHDYTITVTMDEMYNEIIIKVLQDRIAAWDESDSDDPTLMVGISKLEERQYETEALAIMLKARQEYYMRVNEANNARAKRHSEDRVRSAH